MFWGNIVQEFSRLLQVQCESLVIHTSGRPNGGPAEPGFHERRQVLEFLSRALAHTSGVDLIFGCLKNGFGYYPYPDNIRRIRIFLV